MKGILASDIDGTLLPEGERALPPGLFPQIRRLTAEGWLFCAASGRQYASLRRLFAPVADELAYLCENGAVVFSPQGRVVGKTPMPRAQAVALCRDILAAPGCELLISGENMSYLVPKGAAILPLMAEEKGNNVTVLARPEEVPEDLVKVSAWVEAGTAAFPPALTEKWARFHPAVAGREWVDFTLAHKGTGLAQLCAALGVEREDVVVFGDNYNDTPMLDWAGRSYLMASADPALRARYPRQCRSVTEILAGL